MRCNCCKKESEDRTSKNYTFGSLGKQKCFKFEKKDFNGTINSLYTFLNF